MNELVLPTLYGLSLFSGIRGIDYGVEYILPQSKTICYVEGEIFAAKILYQKMQKGELPHAPIYSDVRTFPSVAHNFSEKVDFITAGFPCQPFSKAGSRKGTKDNRWLWDSILQTIKQTRPSFLFLENVSNLVNEWGAFDEISKSLSKIGFDIEWANVRASDVGANHKRNRLFIFAYKQGSLSKLILTNPNSQRRNTNFKNLRCWESDSLWKGIVFTKSHNDGKSIMPIRNQKGGFIKQPKSNFEPSWWRGNPPFSAVCRVDDGISYRMDRLRSLGNAVVPFQASQAYYHLIQRAIIGISKS